MKPIIFYILLIVCASASIHAQQGFASILDEIEKNSTSLHALKKHAEAEQLSSRTGIFLQNPEVGFNYLWGSPTAIGNRTDFNVTQSFDFPSAYKYKSNISDLLMSQSELEYQYERINLLYEARLICIELVYYNALLEENRTRLDYAENIAEAVAKMYEEGGISILDHNKAQLNLANAANDHAMLQAEANNLLAELARLNGGREISMDLQQYPPVLLPADFDIWYKEAEQKNPLLQYMNREVEISENEEKLSRAMSLPKFSAGYMSEKVVGEKYQGLSVGMSIPLWENKNTVKAARAQTAANMAMASDSQLQLYSMLKNQYRKALDLKQISEAYSASLIASNTTDLLKQAYDLGQISLIEYLVEVQFYYETMVKALNTRREMQRAVAEIEKWN